MVTTWLIRLELARDDDGPLSDEVTDALTYLLTENHVQPVLSHRDPGTVLVQMTLDATDEMAARSAAEHMLRDGANTVWPARGLPPFTLAVVEVLPEAPKARPPAS